MRAADRSSVNAPEVLTDPDGKGKEELDKVRAFRSNPATADRSFSFKVYKDAEVKAALEKLFHGKCAYCETFYSVQAPVDVEHYRPKSAVEGDDDHPGYWWLAMDWDNLLPSCIDCNRRRKQPTPKSGASLGVLHDGATKIFNTGKKDAFPIAGTRAEAEGDDLDDEEAYLLDPTRDDPDDFLEYHLDPDNLTGLIMPRATGGADPMLPALSDPDDVAEAARQAGVNARGAVSIQVYGLNRLGLAQERTRVLRHLEFLRYLIEQIDEIARTLENSVDPDVQNAVRKLDGLIDRIVLEIADMAKPKAPYSALVNHWKRQFIDGL